MSKLIFFRHAQASFGADNYDELSDLGKEQSKILGDYLVQNNMQFDKIYVGPLQRQLHTYEIVRNCYTKTGLNIPEPIMKDGLLEHEGHKALSQLLPVLQESNKYVQELIKRGEENPSRKRANHLLIFQYFLDEWAEGRYNATGILPWKEFRKKVKLGLNEILGETGSGETIASFTSGGTISSITSEALNLNDEKRVIALNFSHRNTAFTSFFYSKNKFNLLAFNELPHLKDEMITFV